MMRSSPGSANATPVPAPPTFPWVCAGRSNGRTRGSQTSVSSVETPIGEHSTASPNSPSPSPSCSPQRSSTGETAGHRPQHLSAEPLRDIVGASFLDLAPGVGAAADAGRRGVLVGLQRLVHLEEVADLRHQLGREVADVLDVGPARLA